MSILKKIVRLKITSEFIGLVGANYLRLVRATTVFRHDPPDLYSHPDLKLPAIVAMWHGQHFMVHFAKPAGDRFAGLMSRSADGELAAGVLRRLGVRPIRGSGARGRDQHSKGGASALREMLRALRDGESVVLTADVPKVSRVCGEGIVVLAQRSGRPIVPVAVASRRRLVFGSWDKASVGLPFSRGAIVFGDPILVGRDVDRAQFEERRLAIEASLNDVHARAYAMIDGQDPGARADGIG